MKGYVIWLFVALVCSSMADEAQKLRFQLDEINKDIQSKRKEIERNQLEQKSLNNLKDELDSKISKIQNDLLGERLEMAKIKVKLDRKRLELGQCLNPEKYKESVPRIAKERADEISAKIESSEKDTLVEKYRRLQKFFHPE